MELYLVISKDFNLTMVSSPIVGEYVYVGREVVRTLIIQRSIQRKMHASETDKNVSSGDISTDLNLWTSVST